MESAPEKIFNFEDARRPIHSLHLRPCRANRPAWLSRGQQQQRSGQAHPYKHIRPCVLIVYKQRGSLQSRGPCGLTDSEEPAPARPAVRRRSGGRW